jgi:hypothetical protein
VIESDRSYITDVHEVINFEIPNVTYFVAAHTLKIRYGHFRD